MNKKKEAQKMKDILDKHNNERNNIDWSEFLKEVAEKVTPAEVKAYAEGYLEGLEAVYYWLIKEPSVKTDILIKLKETIYIIGGDLNGES